VRPVDVVRAAPAEQVVRALAEDRAEAQVLRRARDALVDDELGVAERDRLRAEQPLDPRRVRRDLLVELGGVEQRGERVVRRLAEELDAARPREALEALERLGRPLLHLVERRPRDRVRAAEAALVARDEVLDERVHRQVALLRDAPDDPRVLGVVEVVVGVPDVEERVAAQAERLVHLEVEDEVGHRTSSA
jgi:hypothetical protein